MSDNVPHAGTTHYHMEFSQELFTDYLIVIIFHKLIKVQKPTTFTLEQRHTRWGLQTSNQTQIIDSCIQLVASALLEFHPFVSIEKFIAWKSRQKTMTRQNLSINGTFSSLPDRNVKTDNTKFTPLLWLHFVWTLLFIVLDKCLAVSTCVYSMSFTKIMHKHHPIIIHTFWVTFYPQD